MNSQYSRREPALSLLWRKDALIPQAWADGLPVAAPELPFAVRQIVFIDGAVPDAQLLAAGVKPGVVAVMLDPNGNELQQIADYLASHDVSNLAAIDIVAHGSDGALQLGGTVLDAAAIPQYAGDLAAIGAALRPGGAIQLYGCDVAQDAAGVAFLHQLSDATGGASVAAASHPVGAASGGGSWTLNVDVGTVDIAAPFTVTTLADYQGELASPTGDLWVGSWHSLIGDSLNQIDAVNVSGPTALGTTDVANELNSGDSALSHPTGLAVAPARGELFVVNAGFTIYAVPATGGALTKIYAAPDTDSREATGFIGGVVADEASDSLYFTQSDFNLDTGAQIPADTGVFSINENGTGLTQLVYDIIAGDTLYNPTSLGLDLSNNLAFFVENDAYAGGTGAVDLEVGTLTRHNFAQLLQIGDFATGFEINTGLAVDPVNQEIYYSIENFYTPSENGIYSVHYTLSGSLAAVGTVTTLYSAAAAEDPEAIAIDPANGLLYVSGEVPLGTGYTGAAWVGSLSGSAEAPLTQIFQLSTDTSDTTGTFADTAIFEAAPSISAGETVTFSQGDAPVTLDPSVTITDESEPDLAGATVSISSGFLPGDTLNFADQDGITGTYAANGTLTFNGIASVADYQSVLSAVTYSFSGDPSDGGTDTSRTISWSVSDGVETGGVSDSSLTALCFLAGTRITTPGGEVPVEQLAVGDTVLTARGDARPVVWIGMGRVLATRGRRNATTPVIVHKGALGDNMPHHDLRITKGHSLYLDGALIPVEFLVNHRSIVWDDRAQGVQIYHVELETHDVLLANGALAESYRDDGNRWLFRNGNSGWDQPAKPPCAPVLTGGPVVDAVWRRLLHRAGPRPGLPLTDDPDLHLLVNGRRVDAVVRCGAYIFRLPPRPASVRIVSRASAPAELGLARDPRVLGVAVTRIDLCQGPRLRVIEARDASLAEGFHGFEPDGGLRWTEGDAALPAALFEAFDGPAELVLHMAGTTHYALFEERPSRTWGSSRRAPKRTAERREGGMGQGRDGLPALFSPTFWTVSY